MVMNFNERTQIVKLNESRDLLAGIIESAMDAIIAIDEAQRIVLFNSAAERIFGISANEVIGNSIGRFIPLRFRAEYSEGLRRFVESENVGRNIDGPGSQWGLRVTGEEFPVEASVFKVESGGNNFLAVIVRDVTERHRAEQVLRESEQRLRFSEQTLRESEERLRLAQRVASIGTFEWNVKTDVVTWTPELEAMYGLPPGGFGGTRTAFENLVYADDRPRLRKLAESTFATGQPTKGEWRVVWPDGTVHWMAGRWQLLQDECGEPSRVVGVNVDITERKLAEKTLRESEERFRLAVQAGKIYAYEWDVPSDKIVRSGEITGVLGPAGEPVLTRRQLLAKVHPDDRALFNASVAERTPERPNVQITYRLLSPDGSVLWFEKTARAFFDEHGKMIRMIGMVADITERKRAEEARFRHAVVVESSEDAILSVSLDRVITSWNAGAERIYGYKEAEVLGKPIDIIVPPELPNEENNILETLRMGGRIEHFETVRVTKTGKRINVSLIISPIKNAMGETVGCSEIARDITERKRNEMELRTSEERLRLATLAGKMYAYEWNMQTDILVRSPEYVNVLGPTQPESSSRSQIMDRIHPDDRSKFVATIAAFTPENPISEVTYRVLLPGRTQMWLKNSGHAFFDDKGKMLRVIGMVADVTDQKLAEEALFDVSRRLIQAQEQERSRIGRELHDDVVQRLALLAVKLQQLQENPFEAQNRIQELDNEVVEIIDAVQALSHDLHSSKLEYLGVVSGMKSWCADFAERYAIAVEFATHVPSDIPLEIGLCLFRVLQEALRNAVKHSGAKHIEVRLSERLNQVDLIISDSGKGFNVDAAMKGKGLGLTSMRERVRLVNGTITVESTPTHGTKICVRVPVPEHESQQIAV
jgi:PAS domain S-box-containing protein